MDGESSQRSCRGSFEVVKRPELGRDTEEIKGMSATSRSEVPAIPEGIVSVIR